MASDPEFQRASGRVVVRGIAEELVEGFAEEDFRVGDGDDGSVDANFGELARGRVGGRACGVAASPPPTTPGLVASPTPCSSPILAGCSPIDSQPKKARARKKILVSLFFGIGCD